MGDETIKQDIVAWIMGLEALKMAEVSPAVDVEMQAILGKNGDLIRDNASDT